MVNPIIATSIVVAFIVAFGIVLPILDKHAPKYISYRWSVVVVVLSLLIGAVIDFGELPAEPRRILLLGGLIIVGGYIVLRTVEKILANGWHRGSTITASKGDIKLEVKSEAQNENMH